MTEVADVAADRRQGSRPVSLPVRIGVDLGGSKIEAIALAADGTELLRERVATPQGDYAATVAAIVALVCMSERQIGLGGANQATVGLGVPGAESRLSGLIKNANSTCLIGRALRHDLGVALGREVRLANDANCFALSEATDGAGEGADVVFGAILGTGVGAGVVVRGQLLEGANGIAGEWGHNPMPGEADSATCYCGRSHCIELYLSGPGLVADFRRGANGLPGYGMRQHRATSADFPITSPAQLVDLAEQGDSVCEMCLQRYEQRLARALAGVINILDPDVIVLGGGLSNIDRLYDNVPRLWLPHIFSDHVATRLCKPHHGDSSGVRGAAWLWNER